MTSESDNTMQLYDVKEGRHRKSLLSQKYGAANAIFSHAAGCIIYSSTKINRERECSLIYGNLLKSFQIPSDTSQRTIIHT